jgi:hypothetical protein
MIKAIIESTMHDGTPKDVTEVRKSIRVLPKAEQRLSRCMALTQKQQISD